MSPLCINIEPSKYHSINSGITQKTSKDDDASLLGRSSLALEPAGDDISLIGDYSPRIGDSVYPPGVNSLGFSTAAGHTSVSKVKQDTSLIAQEFNATFNK